MSRSKPIDRLVRSTPVVSSSDTVASAVSALLDANVPALPVADERGRFAGVFGEREFFAALFPRYVGELSSAAFMTAALDETIERRASASGDPVSAFMNTEHVEIRPSASDLQVVETFLHHRVLILPVIDDGRIIGVIDRSEFFKSLAQEFLGRLAGA